MLQNDPALVEAVTETRYGPMTYYAIDHYVGKSLEVYGEYSPDETSFLQKIIKPGWVVVNGGANIGSLTVPIAEMVGSEGKVYAFEPQPEAFKLLQKNCSRYSWVQVSDAGLWDKEDFGTISLYKEVGHTNFGGVVTNTGTHKIILVTLDSYLDNEKVDLIFLDIEGAEIKALEGAARLIEKHRPLLYCEDHPEANGASLLSEWASRHNYISYSHKPSLFSANNFKGVKENYFKIAKGLLKRGGEVVSFNLLCIPKEKIEKYRDVVEDQATYYFDRPKVELQIIVPKGLGMKKWAGVCRLGGVGDNLLTASVCRPLKEQGYNVEVITQTPTHVLFENNPFIDKISAYAPGSLPSEDLGQWQDWFRLRSKEYAKFANLSHSLESRHALFPAQTWFWWPASQRRKICAGSYLETAHDIMEVPYTFGPVFFPTDEEKEQARQTRAKLGEGPVIGWCVSGTRIDKVYPYTPFIVARLIKELGAQVILLCAPSERDLSISKICQETAKAQNGSDKGLFHAGSMSIVEETWPVRRILTMAAACDLYIGPDTGPSWGVAFEPLPKIIMLSHASPENITKHWLNTTTLTADPARVPCWPCHQLHNNFDTCTSTKINDGSFSACISDISGETIVAKARELLTGEQ